jgi:TATA binding protein of transcription factor TFIID
MIMSTVKIENVVASTSLADKFDLERILLLLEGADYNKEKFPGLVYRTSSPKAAFLLFTTGKIVCTGTKNADDVRKATHNTARRLSELGIPGVNMDPDIIIQNIVASADIGVDLNLNAICAGLGLENVEYEPEQFPGLVYRVSDPKVVILIFSTGKLVITGGKKIEECERGVDIVREKLENMGLL